MYCYIFYSTIVIVKDTPSTFEEIQGITENVSLSDLKKTSHFSSCHLIRLKKGTAGVSVGLGGSLKWLGLK